MKDFVSDDDDTVIDRLSGALEAGLLPKAARAHAEHLIGRLSFPVRVSILGTPGSGKSELVNMFVGRRLIPKNAVLPTTELVYGAEESMRVTAADGSVSVIDGLDLASLSGAKAAFLRLTVKAPILERISLLEVVTDGTREEMESAADWAVRRTDIALWCSQGFSAGEHAIWSRVPDSLKDHGFLVLTKADALSAEKVLSKRVAALETVVAEEFHSLFAVATLQAIKAHAPDGSVDEAMFHASGGGALTSEILRHAERGRRADFDSAHLFLARYHIPEDMAPMAEPVAEEAEDAPVPATDFQAVAQDAPAVPVGALDDDAPDWSFDDASDDPEAAPSDDTRVPVAPKVGNKTLFADAIGFLGRKGDGLTETATKLGEGEAKPLIDACVDAVEHLVDLFSQDESGCTATDAFLDELSEASDMMVLMQVESGDAPAADAVTLLLQLRRDMEMQLAA